ncbi:hypothetical protein [Burkholderia seminalis]|uniref:hypothetical protein n=1 Tax=Burkholderia seminalis TaxID=488731 RepID=UPI0031DF8CF1
MGEKKPPAPKCLAAFLLLIDCSSDVELRVRVAERGGDRLAHHFRGARECFR